MIIFKLLTDKLIHITIKKKKFRICQLVKTLGKFSILHKEMLIQESFIIMGCVADFSTNCIIFQLQMRHCSLHNTALSLWETLQLLLKLLGKWTKSFSTVMLTHNNQLPEAIARRVRYLLVLPCFLYGGNEQKRNICYLSKVRKKQLRQHY